MTDTSRKLAQFGLDAEALAILRAAGDIVIPELDAVLERFYERALDDPEARAFFDSETRVRSARNAQKAHWERLLSGVIDGDYVASMDRIGRTHARIDLPIGLYMSSYACAAAHVVELLMTRVSRRRFGGARRDMAAMVGALQRAFAFDVEQVVAVTLAVWDEERAVAFDHINRAVDRLAEGDLTHAIPGPGESDYPVGYDPVRRKLNAATARLGGLLGSIQDAMEGLRGVIDDVTRSAGDLSQRTSNQAASLEETASAMEQLTQSVAGSAENTASASDVARDTGAEVRSSVEVVGEAVEAMERIKASSDQIAQITGLIEDIAFQTNLLALNAGVEAARAGEAGRGFAVVASEVRALAQRSSDAAKEIKSLIASSGEQVRDGASLVQNAGRTLGTVASSFQSISELTERIASSSNEQALGLREVNTSVSELDSITQQNAAMVERTTDAMHTMSENAERLRTMLASLRFAASGTETSAAA